MFTIQVKNGQLAAVLTALQDTEPLMAQIAEFLLDETVARFAKGQGPDGKPWAPKSKATIAAYAQRKQAVSLRPLIGPTRQLSNEESYSTRIGEDWVEIAAGPIQAAVMQFGAARGAFGNNKAGRPIPWGTIPARPFLGISAQDEDNIDAAVQSWIRNAIGGD